MAHGNIINEEESADEEALPPKILEVQINQGSPNLGFQGKRTGSERGQD